ncbi:hypothetical protein B0T19DRAFT_111111 [Cercophora scortea]|uniref:Uncharacterized protein n=1 Tax=Cercophora scortea TaxID=314031 RepID=A0AAE0IXI8_9PEZI|nr:hypothetical protein B0T19DRAFT_111111 [Cercophora scortea]
MGSLPHRKISLKSLPLPLPVLLPLPLLFTLNTIDGPPGPPQLRLCQGPCHRELPLSEFISNRPGSQSPTTRCAECRGRRTSEYSRIQRTLGSLRITGSQKRSTREAQLSSPERLSDPRPTLQRGALAGLFRQPSPVNIAPKPGPSTTMPPPPQPRPMAPPTARPTPASRAPSAPFRPLTPKPLPPQAVLPSIEVSDHQQPLLRSGVENLADVVEEERARRA